MTETILQLRSHEVWAALEVVDPVATMAEHLIGRTVGRAGHGHRSPGRLISWSGTGRNGTELVLLDHPEASGACVVPAQCLRSAQAAALAAVAGRELLVPGGVTMAVLGPDSDTQLPVVARHIPDISHVALCADQVGSKVADQLELSGVALSVVPTVADAVFGANFVLATDHAGCAPYLTDLRIGQLAREALLVNATGVDLPAELVERVDQIYVDDLGLLERYPERHLAADDQPGGAERRIAGDLAQLLADRQRPKRSGGIQLVDLLGVHELNADLAYRIYEVATRTGLGVRIAS
jgi:ornithine cyclodeaminase/alanine dehydrogenase-like protein (mu-crystallin family)